MRVYVFFLPVFYKYKYKFYMFTVFSTELDTNGMIVWIFGDAIEKPKLLINTNTFKRVRISEVLNRFEQSSSIMNLFNHFNNINLCG